MVLSKRFKQTDETPTGPIRNSSGKVVGRHGRNGLYVTPDLVVPLIYVVNGKYLHGHTAYYNGSKDAVMSAAKTAAATMRIKSGDIARTKYYNINGQNVAVIYVGSKISPALLGW
ncbi:MAG: hypothetical protein WC346_04025 [Methanogenium sp.]|jgi:hypothetical protein